MIFFNILQVVYRPLRDSKGIPGSDDLVVCLTGYQNQARTNVMVTHYIILLQICKYS